MPDGRANAPPDEMSIRVLIRDCKRKEDGGAYTRDEGTPRYQRSNESTPVQSPDTGDDAYQYQVACAVNDTKSMLSST